MDENLTFDSLNDYQKATLTFFASLNLDIDEQGIEKMQNGELKVSDLYQYTQARQGC